MSAHSESADLVLDDRDVLDALVIAAKDKDVLSAMAICAVKDRDATALIIGISAMMNAAASPTAKRRLRRVRCALEISSIERANNISPTGSVPERVAALEALGLWESSQGETKQLASRVRKVSRKVSSVMAQDIARGGSGGGMKIGLGGSGSSANNSKPRIGHSRRVVVR